LEEEDEREMVFRPIKTTYKLLRSQVPIKNFVLLEERIPFY
jgi:hypothetical protein